MSKKKSAHGGGKSSDNVIKSVETSISIIESLKQRNTARVGEIAEATGSSKGNVSKHLNTLAKHNFVTKTENGYELGLRYLDLGGFVRENLPESRVIKPKVLELAIETGEVAQFSVENNGKAVIIYRESGQQGVSTRTRVGRHLPLYQVASGKAMLAHMPQERVDEIIETHGLEPATENTITDRETLLEELEEIRQRNYAINDAESTKGLYALAAPIRTSNNRLIGACSISGPSHRMRGGDNIDQTAEILLSFVNEIELNLTYS
ncbi:IclR family transcriptional regulator [Natronosalvus halobius]|uniref:IclR family transcriptional regulator n=1 Tax=Natronosalvus halobius TaxID=2953746 RepID=UPI00209F04D3|nr:IclR family transcriptional regulator [Natronosalvus halobius]USZ73671.1 IclR family transcriptional regulator [Natronosalvus halobius]